MRFRVQDPNSKVLPFQVKRDGLDKVRQGFIDRAGLE